jgi:hypothetical protein
MGLVVVQYQVKPEMGDENQSLIESVFEELDERDPGGVRYASLRLADGVSFVHLASVETDDGSNPLSKTAAFGEFQRELKDRCSVQPAPQEAEVVGSYRFFAK